MILAMALASAVPAGSAVPVASAVSAVSAVPAVSTLLGASAIATPLAPSAKAGAAAGASTLGDTSAVFIFYGLAYHMDGVTPWVDPDTLILRNLRTGVIARGIIGAQGPSGYAAVTVDLAGSAAVMTGDSIAASCSNPELQPFPMVFVLGVEDVRSGLRVTSFRQRDVTSQAESFSGGIVHPLSAFPNPSRAGMVRLQLTIVRLQLTMVRPPISGRPEALQIFDAQGCLVRALPMRFVEAGMGTSTWDGRDTAGRRLASGRYWARLGLGGPGRLVSFVLTR